MEERGEIGRQKHNEIEQKIETRRKRRGRLNAVKRKSLKVEKKHERAKGMYDVEMSSKIKRKLK